ncbi:DDB1- and CUL4-associated factor 10 homolog isoform X2 [Tubulanus polymorphus]|uniref:DDB1- and CUL4-associated factor 10 homolog isoform X2 n=1 Tax=Tubulanus polymorphus TaxID=672921 RepID=UPI003DA48FA4
MFNTAWKISRSIMVAACERKSFLLFDPLNGKLIGHKNNAHNDCVNCVRFLDSRIFATCSDDTTISVWDVRYLRHKIRTLYGHSNWVKNIEYADDAGLLLTSGFDGSIYTWDINNYSEKPETTFTRVFHTNGLMRSKLTPDGRKLVISTAGGYLMIVHNLDLTTLNRDLHGFKPNMYRLMQMSQSPVRQGYMYNQVFERQKNRVEFISDFPDGNEAEVIASLQIHPYGWSVLSRNTSSDENSEWTCIHDIQEQPENDEREVEDESIQEESEQSGDKNGSDSANFEILPDQSTSSEQIIAESASRVVAEPPPRRNFLNIFPRRESWGRSTSSAVMRTSSPIRIITGAESRRLTITQSTAPVSSSSIVHRRAITISPIRVNRSYPSSETDRASRTARPQIFADATPAGAGATTTSSAARTDDNSSVTFVIRSGSQVPERTLLLLSNNAVATTGTPGGASKPKIHRNAKRLTHYCEEANVGRGFIKEPCFSSDGRLVCSPFAYGTRLLAFDNDCNELCDSLTNTPRKLTEIGTCISHTNAVLTTKFSPTHCLLISGCLNGNVNFHQPVL